MKGPRKRKGGAFVFFHQRPVTCACALSFSFPLPSPPARASLSFDMCLLLPFRRRRYVARRLFLRLPEKRASFSLTSTLCSFSPCRCLSREKSDLFLAAACLPVCLHRSPVPWGRPLCLKGIICCRSCLGRGGTNHVVPVARQGARSPSPLTPGFSACPFGHVSQTNHGEMTLRDAVIYNARGDARVSSGAFSRQERKKGLPSLTQRFAFSKRTLLAMGVRNRGGAKLRRLI